MRLFGKILVLLLGAAAIATVHAGVDASTGQSAKAPSALEAHELELLLSRDTDAGTRQTLMRKLVVQAQAGDGNAAFYLGALYRNGMDHPARLVERDIESARHWLERCVDSRSCPLFALASLAELELAAGNPKAAMQWSQAWVILERELDARRRTGDPYRQTKTAPYQYTSYQAYLLERCYKAMPNTRDQDALGRAWFDELRVRKGLQLDRMLFAVTDKPEAASTGNRLEISAENQRAKVMEADAPQPISPALGLYLYRGAPLGGRAEAIHLIEALPTPRGARGLDWHARQIKMKPYATGSSEERIYAELPVSFNDWQYSLVPVK